jgi:phenylacetate-coenzyme A ligase PaaK-like adenylate-forming protein
MTSKLSQVRVLVELRRDLRRSRRFDAGDEQQRAAWQADALDRLRRHASARSPFYRDHHRGLEGAPLDQLPVLTKDHLVERFDDLVTDRRINRAGVEAFVASGAVGDRYLGRYRVAVSSGSSGRPGLFVFDRAEWVEHIAAAARARSTAGGLPPRSGGLVRTAKVGSSSPWHLSAQVGATLEDPRRPSLRLRADDPLPELVEALDGWRPDVLSAYPGILRLLAGEQAAGRLHIEPRRVFSAGAVLTPTMRARMVEAWGDVVFDQYVATEAGHLAAECPEHRGMHLLEDLGIVEVVDAAGRPVPPGETGSKLLVTALGSRTVPLIRVELGDAICLETSPCPCGRPAPRVVEVVGRTLDWLHLPATDGSATVAVHPNVFTGVLDAERVVSWQVVEQGGAITVLVTGAEPPFRAEVTEGRIVAALARLGTAPPVAVRVVDRIEPEPSGKQPLVKSSSHRS